MQCQNRAWRSKSMWRWEWAPAMEGMASELFCLDRVKDSLCRTPCQLRVLHSARVGRCGAEVAGPLGQ
eukprot:2560217-Rhodomonas_salina.2